MNEHSEQDEPEVEIHDPTSATDGRVQVLAESLGRRILRLCLYQDNFILICHSVLYVVVNIWRCGGFNMVDIPVNTI